MKNIFKTALAFTAAISLASTALAAAAPASNQGQALIDRGHKEIDQRIDSLNKLSARIAELRNVTADQKSQLSGSVSALVASMTGLRSKIDADAASSTALKADVDSITKGNRIYALMIPEINIISAADRVLTIADMMNALGLKVQSRFGTTTPSSSIQSAISDWSTKVTAARTAAQAAVSLVQPLQPDNGDKTVMASNTATLKAARDKIKEAVKDLNDARKDIKLVIKALPKDQHKDLNATSTSTMTGSTTTQ
jgi:predicted  nucleic acid-binding Zn-ribbon protein